MRTRGFTQIRRSLQASLLALVIGVIAAASASAGPVQATSNIHIKNFGQMDERFYRGAQPAETDYRDLAALGIKTIIDLRDDPVSYAKREAELAGLRYVNIPMSDSISPREEQVEQFLALVNDPASGSFYVHCLGGRHRTGVMGAVYRMNHDGWDFDKVYKEMKAYDFYTRWGHGALKEFVKGYGDARTINVSTGHSSGVSR